MESSPVSLASGSREHQLFYPRVGWVGTKLKRRLSRMLQMQLTWAMYVTSNHRVPHVEISMQHENMHQIENIKSKRVSRAAR